MMRVDQQCVWGCVDATEDDDSHEGSAHTCVDKVAQCGAHHL